MLLAWFSAFNSKYREFISPDFLHIKTGQKGSPAHFSPP